MSWPRSSGVEFSLEEVRRVEVGQVWRYTASPGMFSYYRVERVEAPERVWVAMVAAPEGCAQAKPSWLRNSDRGRLPYAVNFGSAGWSLAELARPRDILDELLGSP